MRTSSRITAATTVLLCCLAVQIGVAAEGPAKPSFTGYYEPDVSQIEPNAPGYALPLDVSHIYNGGWVCSALGLARVPDLVGANGFAVLEYDFGAEDPNRDSMTKPYDYLKARSIPLFVTADTVLHLYHVQFDETLRDIEEREFIQDLKVLTGGLLFEALHECSQLTGDLQEAAQRNVAYLAVAQKLLDPGAAVPEAVADTVEAELALIAAHAGFGESPLFLYLEDYSQYVPRGHYTRTEALQRYFRAMMWYGRMAFLLRGSIPWGPNEDALISPHDADIQTLEALFLATALRNVRVASRTGDNRTVLQIWDRLYGVTAFYVGCADDLTPYDYLWALDQVFRSGFVLGDLAQPASLPALRTQLASLPSPQIFGGTGNPIVPPGAPPEYLYEILDKTKGLRLMGQRFVPDSYLFQHLVFPQVDAYTGDPQASPFTKADDGDGRYVRGYPRGLDVMALLGSKQALHILIDEGDTDYVDFWARFGELKHEFDALSVTDWNRNLYWSWLYSLKALVADLPQAYPSFMRTAAWQKKSLNAALASWAELRHDTILYAKQSYSGTTAGRGAASPPPPGYIEPVPEFFGRLRALTAMTRLGLTQMQILSDPAKQQLAGLEDLLGRMIGIAERELLNQPLSTDDTAYLAGLPKSLESLVTGTDPGGIQTTLVADVHTNAVESEVVEEAVGKVDLIVVACPAADGSIFLAAGPVLSYYEFKHPMSDRLTDEVWRQQLDSTAKPVRPTWYQPLLDSTPPASTSTSTSRRLQ